MPPIGFDDPIAGTDIHLSKDGSTKTIILQKWDTGTLPGRILDISLHVMVVEFEVAAGWTSGGIAFGEFSGSYWHL